MMHQRRSSRSSYPSSSCISMLVLVLLVSLLSKQNVQADDMNAVTYTTTTITAHRDVTDTIITNDASHPQQRRELFWSLSFLSMCWNQYYDFHCELVHLD